MPEFFLPKLKINNNIQTAKRGSWQQNTERVIADISKSLDYDTAEYKNIDSIPDMWARPILFEMALFDGSHRLHERIVGEWRGLLAMLAFKELRYISRLGVLEIDLYGAKAQGQSLFKALGKLQPQNAISSDTLWDKLYAFKYDNKPIGMTSPATLVFTAVDYAGHISGIPWFNGRVLTDPIKDINQSERQKLAGWLQRLRSGLTNHPVVARDPSRESKSVLRAIDDYIGALNVNVDGNIEISPNGLDLNYGIYKYLNYPLKNVEEDIVSTNIKICPIGTNPDKDLLFIGENMWGLPPKDVTIFGTVTLSSVPFGGLGSDKTHIGNIPLPRNTEFRTEEDIFSENLYYIDAQNAFPGAMQVNGQPVSYNSRVITPILPLKEEILHYLDVEYLSRNIRLAESNGNITVSLILPLTFPNRNYEVKRTYTKDGKYKILALSNVPVVNIWPDFVKADESNPWKLYYTYCRKTGPNTFYVKPFPKSSNEPAVDYKKHNRGVVIKTATFPQALVCTNLETSLYAGFILLLQPKSCPSQEKSCTIGVDFGTSATTVYGSFDRNDQPFYIKFNNRSLKVTEAGASENVLFDEFIPDISNIEKAFLSIFHRFESSQSSYDYEPLLDGHIYFLDDFKDLYGNASGMETNLKWGDDRQRAFAKVFLKQLCLQIAAEVVTIGVERVNWRFSYPTAFSRQGLKNYRASWEQIINFCSENSGVNFESTGVQNDMSESIATARYFLSTRGGNLQQGFVSVDVGGGTTDISIWQGQDDNSYRLQTSLLIAGRTIFLDLLKKKPRFLGNFDVDDNKISILENVKNGQDFYTQTEALLAKEGKDLYRKLDTRGAKEEVRDFIGLLSFAFSGVFYYIGLLLGYLKNNGEYHDKRPDICIGGNGANILHWLNGGSAFNKHASINNLLKAMIVEAAGFTSTNAFEFNISPNPKAEAACGLVVKNNYIKPTTDKVDDKVVAGEEYSINSAAKAWDGLVTSEDINHGLQVAELSQTRKFITIYNKYAAEEELPAITVSEDDFARIRNELTQYYNGLRSTSASEIQLEPIFVKSLKTILEMKSDEWAYKTY